MSLVFLQIPQKCMIFVCFYVDKSFTCDETLDLMDSEILRAFLVQLAVLSNHQNGRDTHIRQIKIYGPRQ